MKVRACMLFLKLAVFVLVILLGNFLQSATLPLHQIYQNSKSQKQILIPFVSINESRMLANLEATYLPTDLQERPPTGKQAADIYMQSTSKAGLMGYSRYDQDRLWAKDALGIYLAGFVSSTTNKQPLGAKGLSLGGIYLKEIFHALRLSFRGDVSFEKFIGEGYRFSLSPFFLWRYFPIYLGIGGLGLEGMVQDTNANFRPDFAMNWQVLGGLELLELFDCWIFFVELKWKNILYDFDESSANERPRRFAELLIGTALLL